MREALRRLSTDPRVDPWLAAALGVTTATAVVDADAAGFVALPLAAVLAYRIGTRGAGWRGVLAVAFGFVVLELAFGPSTDAWVPVALGCWGLFWLGHQVGVRRRLVAELAQRAGELEAEEDAFARLSVRRERARIARDLHDIVAHHLAVIVVQAGAGRIASAPVPERTRERFAAIGHAGEQALEDMARLVDLIQREGARDTDGLARLRVLVDQARAGGLDVRLGRGDDLPGAGVPTAVADTAFRVVQEGLTNAIKHARGAAVTVRVTGSEAALEVAVHDEGSAGGSDLGTSGAGLGLTGMRERVQALGGRLDAGPSQDGGWTLRARLPLSDRAPARLG